MRKEYVDILMRLESALTLADLLSGKEGLCQEELDLLKVCEFQYDTLNSLEDIYFQVCKTYSKLLDKNANIFSDTGVLLNFRMDKLPDVEGKPPIVEVVEQSEPARKKRKKESFIDIDQPVNNFIPAARSITHSDYLSAVRNEQKYPTKVAMGRSSDGLLAAAAGFHLGGLNPITKTIEGD